MFKLRLVLIMMIWKDMKEVFRRELEDSEYLSQKDFTTCQERANAGIKESTKRAKKYLGLMICFHRERGHSENRADEITSISKELSSDDVKKASIAAGWKN